MNDKYFALVLIIWIVFGLLISVIPSPLSENPILSFIFTISIPLAVLFLIFLIIKNLFSIFKKRSADGSLQDQEESLPSKETLTEEQEKFINGVSWPALLMGPLWYVLIARISLIQLFWAITPINWIFAIYLIWRGRRMSWESGKWENFTEFHTRHKKMVGWGIIIGTIQFSLLAIYYFIKFGGIKPS